MRCIRIGVCFAPACVVFNRSSSAAIMETDSSEAQGEDGGGLARGNRQLELESLVGQDARLQELMRDLIAATVETMKSKVDVKDLASDKHLGQFDLLIELIEQKMGTQVTQILREVLEGQLAVLKGSSSGDLCDSCAVKVNAVKQLLSALDEEKMGSTACGSSEGEVW